jgi:hypothetical protein
VLRESKILFYLGGQLSGGVMENREQRLNSWTRLCLMISQQQNNRFGFCATIEIQTCVWVGTGEGNPRNSLNSGEGIF